MKFIITNKSGQLIEGINDTIGIESEITNCNVDCERVFCKLKNTYRRQGVFKTEFFNYYIYSYDQDVTNRIFKFYNHAFSILAVNFEKNIQNQKIKESQKTRRLKHNLITHSSNILQELYKLFPQDSFRNGCNHLTTIENVIKKDTSKAAYTYLKVLKNSNLMKAEFDVYEMLENENPYLDFSIHSIHKVLILTLNPFWLDLVEKNVNINIEQYHGTVTIDYKSVSVILSHIFDNMSKYIMPHSSLHISFVEANQNVIISMEMTSLKIEPTEIEIIFTENYSGFWAKKLDLDGDGIGMYVVNKLAKLNGAKVFFDINYDNKSTIILDGMPYENNRINIELKK
jgi:hypothetical protein